MKKEKSVKGFFMIDVKIGLVAPYPNLAEKALKIAKKKGMCLKAQYAAVEQAIAVAKAMERDGVDVIVAREGTEFLIKEHLNIPTIPIKVCNFDIIAAIMKSGTQQKNIILANFMGRHHNVAKVGKALGISIQDIRFATKDAYHAILKNFDKDKWIVVGGGLSCSVAEELGFKTVLLESADESIEYALDNAHKVARSKFDEKQKRMELLTIVNQIEHGIVAVDSGKKITVFNSTAERLFHLAGTDVADTHRDFILDKTNLTQVMIDNKKHQLIENINGTDVIVRSVPIISDKRNLGGVSSIHEACKVQKMEENIRLSIHSRGLTPKNYTFGDIVGKSDSLTETITKARKYAKTDFTILITGESGTGKELFAHSIVNESSRRTHPFIAINCAAIPSNLLEAELFGYEEGSFTGAKKGGKPGYFEIVHNGTIFLDEIGELSFDLQGRLLRVTEQKEIIKVGGTRVIPVNVRIISATNRNLSAIVSDGRFREDLYYRLSVLHLSIPPLRDRIGDVLPIASHMLNTLRVKRSDKEKYLRAIRNLKEYPWKGNIRELSNLLTQLVVLTSGDISLSHDSVKATLNQIIAGDMQNKSWHKMSERKNSVKIKTKASRETDETEASTLRELLAKKDMKIGQIAQTMGVSRATLWRKLRKYDLSR
ncbi:MAG: sigma 54-interacting transcriptional regulator [Deltaproteobacteria bacterium]|nr:sigma 54-interacting transcriptional regulator [Deltaproteobacteria bacterium]